MKHKTTRQILKSLPPRDGVEGDKRNLSRDFRGLVRLWPDLRPHKKLVIAAALLIPLISLFQMALPLILKRTIDQGIMKEDYQVLLWGAGAYLAAVLLEYACRAGQGVTTALAVHRMIKSLRSRLIRHVLELKSAYHDRSMSGALVTRATSDFDNMSEALNQGVLTSVVDISVLLGCLGGMFFLNWKLALCALVILPLVAWLVRWFSMALKNAMLRARRKVSVLNAFTQECLYGNATIKLLTAENEAERKYDAMNVEFRNAQMASVILDAVMFSVLDGIASITIGVVLWIAVTQVGGAGAAAGALSAGVMVAFVQYIQQLFEPLKHLGNKMAMLQGAFTAIERIFGVLETDDKVRGERKAPAIRGHVEFDDITFSYEADERQGQVTLDGISFNLEAGRSLALVGPTGSGKSTIIKLIAKLYDKYEGTIRIDGHDLTALDPVTLRHQMAIVPQDIALFDGSVAFNIALGLPGIERSDVVAAAEAVGADRFIERLPGAYDHVVQEQGANLSHGQRQLIAFARALVRNPKIVILDEATSSVDPEAEAEIQRAIARLLQGRTVIVIAHRLSTIRRCDQILVLEQGRLVEQGHHDELLAKRGAYFELHQAREIADPSGESAAVGSSARS